MGFICSQPQYLLVVKNDGTLVPNFYYSACNCLAISP